jgi:hypothetical protein
VLLPSDIAALKQVVADRDIFIVSDEVYEHIIFDGRAHESLLKDPLLYAKSFRHQFLRQNLPHHRLENRLLRGAAVHYA